MKKTTQNNTILPDHTDVSRLLNGLAGQKRIQIFSSKGQ